ACLIGLLSIDLLSVFITDASALIIVRLFHGIIGGLLVGIAYGVIARTANPDRAFGVLLFVQFGLGGLGVMLLPRLVPVYGTQALFIALILFSLATLAMVPFLDRYPPRKTIAGSVEGPIQVKPLTLTLLAIFLFQAINMALLAYIIRLGISYGLDRDYVSTALGLATWVALLGPGLVIVVGTKYGRFKPLFLVMGLTLAGTALFHLSGDQAAYLIANCGTGITWGMVMAYLLGMSSQFDRSGRTAAAAGFVSKMGLATGPLVAGQLLTAGYGFGFILNAALILFVLCTLVMLIPARQLDRQPAHDPAGTPG
ncbi:MAG: MFS transporter, partial [Pseudomonadota bacterium]